MAQWAVEHSGGHWASERLFQHDAVSVPVRGRTSGTTCCSWPVSRREPWRSARSRRTGDDTLLVAYARRAFDDPPPADRAGPMVPRAFPAAATALDATTTGGWPRRFGREPTGGPGW
jgi:hypothetical protein